MTALDELLAIEKARTENKSNINKLIDKMVNEESDRLGRDIIASLQESRSEIACAEGYTSDYIAVCHQTRFSEYHSYSEIMDGIYYSLKEYSLPEELRNLVNDEDTEIICDEDGEIIKDGLTELESDITHYAHSYVMGVIQDDWETADREAVLRGEIESGRDEEYSQRETFTDSREAAIFKDKAEKSYCSFNEKVTSYEQLRSQLFKYFGVRFVKRFMNRIINNFKKQSAGKYPNHNEEDDFMLRTVWDVICVSYDAWRYFENSLRALIYDELEKLNATEKILLWYFNTYRNNSKLDLRLDRDEIGWKGAGIYIKENYNCEEEIVNVMYQRIMWYAEDYSNYRTLFCCDDHTQENLDQYREEALEPWENKTAVMLVAEYEQRFDEKFPLDPEKNKEVLLECVASDTPWSKDTDLTIKIETQEA